MSRPLRRKVRQFRVSFTLWLVSLTIAVAAQGGGSVDNVVVDGIVCGLVVFGLRRVNQGILPRMKRASLVLYALVAALAYFGVVIGCILLTIALVVYPRSRSVSEVMAQEARFFSHGWAPIVSPFLIAVGLAFVVEISRRVGTGRMYNWLSGRYRRPREEVRVLMMLDLSGSTPIAEKLGALRFSYLLRDFFDDLTVPLQETEAEVVGYVGDEAVLSWPMSRGLEDGNPLRCFLLFKQAIAKRSDWYLKQYGLVPQFKGALHAGPVVATEVGQTKTEVVLHGDALNTAARILGECNALSAELLISAELADQIGPVEGFGMESMGALQLRGKGEPVGIVRATVVA